MDTHKHQPNDSVECAEFQEQLPDILAAGEIDITEHPHLKTCANCAALVRDLQYIAETARQLLPAHDPSPDVWDHIKSALSQDVGAEADAPPVPIKVE